MVKLITMFPIKPFMKWGLDFLAPLSLLVTHMTTYFGCYQLCNEADGGKGIKDQYGCNHNSTHL
jgi:hypothetical protein